MRRSLVKRVNQLTLAFIKTVIFLLFHWKKVKMFALLPRNRTIQDITVLLLHYFTLWLSAQIQQDWCSDLRFLKRIIANIRQTSRIVVNTAPWSPQWAGHNEGAAVSIGGHYHLQGVTWLHIKILLNNDKMKLSNALVR